MDRYNAKLIVPVVDPPADKNNETVIYGFISIDSLNKSSRELFGENDSKIILNLANSAADEMFILCSRIEKARNIIDQTIRDRSNCIKNDIKKAQRYSDKVM